MSQSFLHLIFALAGSPPKGVDAAAYYSMDATFVASCVSLCATILTGLVVYVFVTRRQQQHLDFMRVSDRLKFIYELEEEFRKTIHVEGMLISSQAQDNWYAEILEVVEHEILQDSDPGGQQSKEREMRQLKLFFDLPRIEIGAEAITMRPFEMGRFLQMKPLAESTLSECRIADLVDQVRGKYIAVDDRMLSRIGILFHRLDRAMQAQLFSGSDAIAFWKLLRYGGKLYFSFLLHRSENDIRGSDSKSRRQNFDRVLGRYSRIFASFLLYFQTVKFTAPIDDFLSDAHIECLKMVSRTLKSAQRLPGARETVGQSTWKRLREYFARRMLARRIGAEIAARRAKQIAAGTIAAAAR